MQADILRKKFLEFFKSKKHKIVSSDSLVPEDDPTILFTPAGMNQFKKQFLGFDAGYSRAATCQRCLRTDDLDKVGKTTGHHTFFEMLGNFSFGDYFKDDAINWAWEFLTEELKIEKDKLWVSVYKDDAEAYKIWREKIKVPADKIIKLGDKENFWPSEAKEKGPNGPCGPCSEIFYDQGNDIGCKRPGCNPSCSCGRFVEVWNLVFTQFNRREGGVLEPLPKKNIDTGMGLERLAAVMQGVKNNFETELFQALTKEIIANAGVSPKLEFVYAVADHLRAVVFAIYDGVVPSNEDRGYVVRKLIRKSTLHLRALGIEKPFLYKLVPVLLEVMNDPYPELNARKENIAQIVLVEEKNFISTLKSSPVLFKDKFKDLLKKQDPGKAGIIAFQLYDTYGIPLELSKDWLDKQGIEISQKTFDQELLAQVTRSKTQSAMKGDVFSVKELDYITKETRFLGYEGASVKAKIIEIIDHAHKRISKITLGMNATIILDKTVFYPESGGQIGDKGKLVKGKNIFEVLDTKKVGKVILHIGQFVSGFKGGFKKGDLVLAGIDLQRRLSIARNHTATHLLQAALRKVLGPHVQQQGSLVACERLRFDFTHFKDLSQEELDRVEEEVNNYIIENYHLGAKQARLAQAKKSGALAFFGEKYEDKVRVVSVGDISQELCGGTHLNSTGQIGLFKIVQEGSVASGVRRIEAVTGKFAYKTVKEQEDIVSEISDALSVSGERIVPELQKRLSRIKELEKQLYAKEFASVAGSVEDLLGSAKEINGVRIITKIYSGIDMDLLRKTVDLVKQKADKAVIALGSNNQGRALLVMGITGDLCQKGLDAAKLIQEVSPSIGGSGGGRKDFAQAGGNNPENFPAAFEKLEGIINNLK